ncbi:unnamed protein product [Amoebophrya sp. A120]|nr:unnamed protein product [Amoebophrya sp. A120]|eukprot:GSA120T00010867001.1
MMRPHSHAFFNVPTAFWDAASEDNDAAMRQLLAGRGQKALAAIHAASSAGQNAMALAVNMAQESNLAANLANQAQAYLERYVYGRPMSALPANVAPEPPALMTPPREIAMRGIYFPPCVAEDPAVGVAVLSGVASLLRPMSGSSGGGPSPSKRSSSFSTRRPQLAQDSRKRRIFGRSEVISSRQLQQCGDGIVGEDIKAKRDHATSALLIRDANEVDKGSAMLFL